MERNINPDKADICLSAHSAPTLPQQFLYLLCLAWLRTTYCHHYCSL